MKKNSESKKFKLIKDGVTIYVGTFSECYSEAYRFEGISKRLIKDRKPDYHIIEV